MLSRHRVNIILLLVGIPFFAAELHAQSKPYEGPTDEAGDPGALRVGLMNGNRVSLRLSNKVALGGWPDPNVSMWPNDATGLNTFDSFNLVVGDMVFIQNDSIPVTDEAVIEALGRNGGLDTLWYAQSASLQPNFMDINTAGTVEWGFNPVFGYFNELDDYPAMSNRPESWPPNGWPSRGFETKWPGEWNGRFGRGVRYADLEAYFAANDAQDQENLQPLSRVKYYPRRGVKIGDLRPNQITVQGGMAWGGLGLRVEVRAYQWNNQQSRDAIFFEYNISNISEYDLVRAVLGFYLDAANGNKAPTSGLEDQIGFFDTFQDFVYTWSRSGTGFGGGTPGISGWAFLESPGVGVDNIDNDEDAITDERRDNDAGQLISGTDNVIAELNARYDMTKFMEFFAYKSIDQIPAVQRGVWWTGDEDADWKDGDDANGNGVYDIEEETGDDIGLDGVGPGDLNYFGPDADGTECNHRPDYLEGFGSEPNFDATDIGESDMLGLTSFTMFPHPQTNSPQLRFDEAVYDTLATHRLQEFFGTPSNLYAAFGSGTFRFAKGRSERLSMAQVNSYEELAGLNAPSHAAPSLYVKKNIVQGIYESDYRFAQPPVLPTLTAKAGDGRVYLSWDDKADKLTRERFLRGINDFEGYRVYKATDKHFLDAEVLRDTYGNPAGKKPIFQCDKIDGITGIPSYTVFNGLGYNLGTDSGIRHYFVDENVQNGRTYYYALVAYDYGLEEFGNLGVSIAPAENNAVIDLDENENIRFVGKNVQVVTPRQQAAGYVGPEVTIIDPNNLQANAVIQPVVYNLDVIKPNHLYKVKFETVVVGYLRTGSARHIRDQFVSTAGFSVYDATESEVLVYQENAENQVSNNWRTAKLATSAGSPEYILPGLSGITSDVFDGLQLVIRPTGDQATVNLARTGWVNGNGFILVTPNPVASQYFAYEYEIIFSSEPYQTRTTRVTGAFPVWDVNNARLSVALVLLNQSFPFHVINRTFPDSAGYLGYEELDLVVHDVNGNRIWEPDSDYVLVGYPYASGSQMQMTTTVFGISFPEGMPDPGEVYRLSFNQPLRDSIMFKVNEAKVLDEPQVKPGMERIKVVPNPYIVTNAMEPAISNRGFNQRRVLLFTHLPAQCTIKIFTSSGVFIRELEIDNPVDDGTTHWDMLTKEGLEIASGVYVYQVKAKATGDEKFGKFAVVK